MAKKLNYKFIDVDKLIENHEGSSINLIFKNKSEKYFRKIERDITLSQLKNNNSVISLGGGAILNTAIRRNVKKLSVSFWLDLPIDELIIRLKKNTRRPLLFKKNIAETAKKIYFSRKKIYSQADFKIKCNSLNPSETVNKILDLYEKSDN